MASQQQLSIGYWAIRGLAAPLRMMACYAGTPFEARLYECKEKADGSFDRDVWLAEAKPALRERNPLINLPYIVDKDVVVTQSNACLLYLGRKFDMLGDGSESELCLCEQLLCEVFDLRNQVVGYAYSARGSSAEETAKFFAAIGPTMAKLEAVKCKGRESAFLVGAKASAPDFHLWEMLDQLNIYAAAHSLLSPVPAYPSLSQFHRDFAALEQNAKYLASPLHTLPCNNPSARVGAVPEGGAWVPGQTVFAWGGRTGQY